MSELIISTENLTKKFKKQLSVNKLHLQVKKGEIYGFLGPNGAGKTTTIRMLLGLTQPTSGSVRIFDQDITKHRISILRQVGSLVESPSFYGKLTGRENLGIIRQVLGLKERRIDYVLQIVRLTKAQDQPVNEYSLGMKQRLGIAMALMGNPKLLILDEPTNGLDPAGIQEIRELIKALPTQYGMTVLVSSHLLSEIDQMATQVGIINKGSLIFQDSLQKLREKSNPSIKFRMEQVDRAIAFLQHHSIPFSLDQDNITFEKMNNRDVAKINEMFVKNGIQVFRIEEEKRSLEDIFLELTGKEGSL